MEEKTGHLEDLIEAACSGGGLQEDAEDCGSGSCRVGSRRATSGSCRSRGCGARRQRGLGRERLVGVGGGVGTEASGDAAGAQVVRGAQRRHAPVYTDKRVKG